MTRPSRPPPPPRPQPPPRPSFPTKDHGAASMPAQVVGFTTLEEIERAFVRRLEELFRQLGLTPGPKGGPGSGNPNQPRDPQGRWTAMPAFAGTLIQVARLQDQAVQTIRTRQRLPAEITDANDRDQIYQHLSGLLRPPGGRIEEVIGRDRSRRMRDWFGYLKHVILYASLFPREQWDLNQVQVPTWLAREVDPDFGWDANRDLRPWLDHLEGLAAIGLRYQYQGWVAYLERTARLALGFSAW